MNSPEVLATTVALSALPEPAGFRARYRSEPGMIGHYPWAYADQRRRRVDRPEHETQDLYTTDQMRAYGETCARAALPGHLRVMAAAVLRQLAEAFPREELDLDAVRSLAHWIDSMKGKQ